MSKKKLEENGTEALKSIEGGGIAAPIKVEQTLGSAVAAPMKVEQTLGTAIAAPVKVQAPAQKQKQETFSYEKAPSYTSKYQSQIDALANQLLSRPAFSYDPEKDSTYQQYKTSYTRQGQRAMTDTLGQVSARTGGLASSYAQSAGQQTYDNYMAALADKIPELKQLAYEMYLDEGDTLRSNLSMLQGLDNTDYGRYADQLSQYNTDRNFAYGMYQDDRNYNYQLDRDAIADRRYQTEWDYNTYRDLLADQRYNTEWNYQVGRDQIADQRYDQQWQHQLDREAIADQRYDTEWGHQVEQDRLDNEYRNNAFRYQQDRDAISDQRYADETAYNREQDRLDNEYRNNAFQYQQDRDAISDQRYADKTAYDQGIYADELSYQRALDKAETMAMAGDFSGYKALGYTENEIAVLKTAYDQEMARAASGGSSSGGSKGSGKSGTVSTGIIDTMLSLGSERKAYEYLISLGLSENKSNELMGYYRDEKYKQELAANPRTWLDYDEDEGIFTWNRSSYGSMEDVLDAMEDANLTAAEKNALKKKFAMYGMDLGE